MNAFNAIDTLHRFEDAGFDRKQAEALANEHHLAMLSHVTHEQLKAALDAQTIRMVGVLGAIVVGASTVLGVILS